MGGSLTAFGDGIVQVLKPKSNEFKKAAGVSNFVSIMKRKQRDRRRKVLADQQGGRRVSLARLILDQKLKEDNAAAEAGTKPEDANAPGAEFEKGSEKNTQEKKTKEAKESEPEKGADTTQAHATLPPLRLAQRLRETQTASEVPFVPVFEDTDSKEEDEDPPAYFAPTPREGDFDSDDDGPDVTSADEKAAVEAKRVADEKAAVKAKRVADEKAAVEAKRVADEKAAVEAKRVADEKAAVKAKRVADEKAAAEAKRVADEKAAAEAKRVSEPSASENLAFRINVPAGAVIAQTSLGANEGSSSSNSLVNSRRQSNASIGFINDLLPAPSHSNNRSSSPSLCDSKKSSRQSSKTNLNLADENLFNTPKNETTSPAGENSSPISSNAKLSGQSMPSRNLPGVETPRPPMSVPEEFATAIATYQATKPNQLSFSKGDIIKVVLRTNRPWHSGILYKSDTHLVNGIVAFYPSNYVKYAQPNTKDSQL